MRTGSEYISTAGFEKLKYRFQAYTSNKSIGIIHPLSRAAQGLPNIYLRLEIKL